MTTLMDTPQQQGEQQQQEQPETDFTKDLSAHSDVKSSNTSQTAPTVVESSEEFTLSGEMTTTSCPEQDCAPSLRLSNMVILEEAGRPRKVHFATDVTIIKEEDIAVAPPVPTRKSRKDRKKDADAERSETVLPQDIWWSADELQNIELNANYMVKESHQYQEEVIVTVLYNKAFQSAANLGKSIAEEEVPEKLRDVTQFSHTLEKWTAVGHSRRGLENMVSDKAVVDAVQSRTVVLQFQKELKSRCDSSDGPTCVAAQHAGVLAERCQDASRTSRILARMMGQADADALATAEELCAEEPRLPEPPGRYSGDRGELDYGDTMDNSSNSPNRAGRRRRGSRRGSLLKTVKKTVGNVFRRVGSHEVSMKRIRKIQLRKLAEEEKLEPPRRPSSEFRKSFVDSLDYGKQ